MWRAVSICFPLHGTALPEFFERLPTVLKVKVPWTQRDALFRAIDRDKDGLLDFERDFYPTFRRHTAAQTEVGPRGEKHQVVRSRRDDRDERKGRKGKKKIQCHGAMIAT